MICGVALLEEWSIRRRVLGLTLPVVVFTVSYASTATGSVMRRISFLPLALVLALALYLLPAMIALGGVRLGTSFVVCVAAFCVAAPVALIAVAQSTSSTAGLLIGWVPIISGTAAVVLTPVDWYCRRVLREATT
jgi:hypothetical protein